MKNTKLILLTKGYFLLVSFILGGTITLSGQCSNNNSLDATVSAPTAVGVEVTLDNCVNAGEYLRVNGLVAGAQYQFNTCGASFDTQITIYAESGGGSLAYNDDYCGYQSRVLFTPAVSGDYRVVIDRFYCQSSSSCTAVKAILVTPPPGPTNDQCSAAETILCGDTKTGSTSMANAEASLTCIYSLNTAPGVWYKFVGTGQEVVVSTNGSGYDTRLGVFSGSCGSLVCVDADDDSGPGLNSLVNFTSVPGIDYYIYVTGFFTASGNYQLSLTCTTPGDICSDAFDIACGDVVTGNTSIATGDGSLPFCGTGSTSAGGIWYHFVGTGDDVEVTTCNSGSNYDTKLFVFDGSCTSLNCITGNDDTSCSFSSLRSRVSFTSVIGTDYYIYVTGFNSSTGNYELSLTCTSSCAPPNAICQSATVSLNASGAGTLSVNQINNGSTADCGLASMVLSQTSFDCSDIGINNLTLTVTDNNFNTATCTAVVTVADNIPPNAICNDITVLLDASGNGSITVGDIDGGSSDACGGTGPALSRILSSSSFTCADIGSNSVTLTVYDAPGNSATCTATVTVSDVTPPSISCPTLSAVNGCSAIVPDLTTQSGTVLANSPADFSGVQGNNGWQYGRYSAFDTDGFSQLPNFTGFVWNNPGVGAILDFPQLDANGGHPQFEGLTWAVRRWTSPFTGTIQVTGDFFDRDGNCGDGAHVRIFQNTTQVYEFLNIPTGSTGYNITLTVNAGDRIDFAIDPIFDAACDDTHFTAFITAIAGGVTYADNCGVVSVTQSPAAGTVVGPGSTTITVTVSDAAGQISSCTSTLNVNDTEAPTANCQNLMVQIGAGGTASVTPAQVNSNSIDNCGIDPNGFSLSGQTSYDCSDVGSAFNVTLTVTDNAGMTATCPAVITVADGIGNCNQAPTAICQNVTVNADANCEGNAAPFAFDGGSSDPEGGALSISVSPPGPYPLGTTNVTLTVTDPDGESDNCSATITVEDVTDPNITCPFDITVNVDPGVCGAVVNYEQPSATDNCGMGGLPTSLSGFTYMGTFEGHTYFLSNTTTTPEDAHAQAIANGGHLVTINSAAENNFVASFSTQRIWIGHTDRDSEGTFEWVTGEPVVYTNWAPGEPNNYGGNEDWAVINWSGTNPDWNDWFFSATALFAVEFDGGTIPTMLESGLGIGATFPVGTTTETWKATDDAGNMDQCSFTVTVIDNIPPVAQCQNVWAPLTAAGSTTLDAITFNHNSSDDCGIASYGASKTTFYCSDVGVSTITLTVTDNNGLSSSCTSTLTIYDNTPPVAVCQNTTVQLGSSGTATISTADINNGSSDACGIGSLSLSETSFDCDDFVEVESTGWINEFHYDNSGTDANEFVEIVGIGDISSWTLYLYRSLGDDYDDFSLSGVTPTTVGDYNFYVIPTAGIQNGPNDGLALVDENGDVVEFLSYEGGLTATAGPAAGMSATAIGVSESSSTGADESLQLQGTGMSAGDFTWGGPILATPGAPNTGQTLNNIYPQVTLTVTDENGNSSTCTASVIVEDNIAPTISCPSDINTEATSPAGVVVSYATPTGMDNCTPITTQTTGLASGATFPIGTTTNTFVVTDIAGATASCSFDVNVTGLAPDIECPANMTVNTDLNQCSAVVTFAATETTGIPPSIISYSHAPGSTFPVGTTTVAATATNAVGTDDCSFVITVEDNQAPSALCKNATVQLNASGSISITAADVNNGSNDACGIGGLSVVPSGFDCDDVGDKTATLTVTDIHGNTATCTATVTVEDNVAPNALCKPATIMLDGSGSGSITTADINNGSNDACGIASLSLSQEDFGCENVGANTVTLTVTDNNSQVSTCTATVTVVDKVNPNAVCKNATVQLNPSGNGAILAAAVDGGSNDACGIAGLSASPLTFDCSNVGSNTVTLTVTDSNGNTSTCTGIVTVEDNVAPTAVCKPATVQLDAGGSGGITAADVDGGSSDACGVAGLSVSPSSFGCGNVGTNTVTLTVTDSNGNPSTCTATVTVEDNVAPTAVCKPATVQLDASGSGSVSAADVDGGSNDACGITGLSVAPSTFGCGNVGGNTVTLTVTDNNGQTATCTATVTVEDNVAPTAVCKPATVQLDDEGNGSITAADIDNGSNDACGIAGLSVAPSTFGCGNVGGNTVTLTVTDNNGQTATCTATVTVEDNVAPTALCKPATVQLDDDGNGSITAAEIDNGSNDACDIASLSASPSSFSCDNLGANTVTLTVTDSNGNPSTCTATVTVEDNIDPVITCPGPITSGTDPGECGASVDFVVTATDNCDETTIVCTIGGEAGEETSGNCATNNVDLSITFDNYPEETSWMIRSMTTGVVVESGGPYTSQPDGSTLDLSFDLADGDYMFAIMDAEGDGICCTYGTGSYTLSSEGNPIVSGGMFTTADKSVFCVETPIPGTPPTVVESGDFFPVGTTTVTCTVTDGSGNMDVCTFDITVNDTEAPMIDTPCPGPVTLCGAQNVFWTPPTATDNCGVVQTDNNYNPGDFFDVGTYTVTYTFYDEAGLSVSCSFDITINPVPDVTISQEDVPLWCQGVQVLTANVLNPDELTYPLTFEWSDGLPGDPVVIVPANGTYTVTVTDALGCATEVSATVDEDISSLLSAYTIISGEELEMYASDVLGGGVGVEDADENEIALVTNIFTFLRANADDVEVDGSSFINEFIDDDFEIDFPTFQSNPYWDNNNVTVPASTTMTLTGSNYGNVTVQAGATLILDVPQIYLFNLITANNATILLTQPTEIMIRRRMTIGQSNVINPDGYTSVIYVSDNASIGQGSDVTINIYAPEGLDVSDSGASQTTYMTGMFISQDRIISDHNVVWNWNLNCSFLPESNNDLFVQQIDNANPETAGIDKGAELINVYPNPSSGMVNLDVDRLLNQEVELYLYDSYGQQLMRKSLGILEVPTITIDLGTDRYPSGMYQASLKAGEQWYNVRFVLTK